MTRLKNNYSIAIHGGAGTFSRKSLNHRKEKMYLDALKKAVSVGESVLKRGGIAIDAVLESVVEMENSSMFNAGKGSVFSYKGQNEMDASIMDGKTLNAGAVAAITLVKNPIVLAKEVMDNSKHVILSGEGAKEFAIERNVELKESEYFFDEFRFRQWQEAKEKHSVTLDHDEENTDEKYGTVGAVALDRRGNLSAATSTGGMVNKRYGRIGDSPLIGSGTYADNNSCAVSCTGQGEFFIRLSVAHEISSLIKYKGYNLQDAVKKVVHTDLNNFKGKGGLIAIDSAGNISMEFNTTGMYRASVSSKTELNVQIF